MNQIPAFNGPGLNYNYSQTIYPAINATQGVPTNSAIQGFPTNNTIQGVPMSNVSQYTRTNNVIQGVPMNTTIQAAPMGNNQVFHPTPSISTDNNMYATQPQASHVQCTTNGNQYYHRTISTSDDEKCLGFEDNKTEENPWQVIKTRTIKRRKINTGNSHPTTISNKFAVLTEKNVPKEGTSENNNSENKTPKPPPIFIYGVVNYGEMVKKFKPVIEDKQYITKCLANNTIKIICDTPDTYRQLIKLMRENNIIHHTYQLKEERAFRIVIKYLHYTTDITEIKQELTTIGHQVRNIINGRHRVTKEPLNLSFADLEPATNNKDIYKLKYLQNRAIQIRPPKKVKGITHV